MHPNARLAVERRQRFLAMPGQPAARVVAFQPANKAYLSGYHSMTHDVAPAYCSAAVMQGSALALVTSAADAGPALEMIGDPAALFRYGRFWFRDAAGTLGFDAPGHADFGSALRAALDSMPGGGPIGTDDPVQAAALGIGGIDLTDRFRQARAIKHAHETDMLRRACRIAEQGIARVSAEARVGMTEHALAAMVGEVILSQGAVPRFVVVTSGPRSALADAYPADRTIQPGDLVRLDIGCAYQGYWADVARTLVVGPPDALQQSRHDAIVAGFRAACAQVQPGVRVADVFHAGVEGTQRAGITDYARHHCGHGIGLAGYEFPLIDAAEQTLLKPGMVLCVETPFYEIGWGGMMVEDMVLVTETGHDSLSTLDHSLAVISA